MPDVPATADSCPSFYYFDVLLVLRAQASPRECSTLISICSLDIMKLYSLDRLSILSSTRPVCRASYCLAAAFAIAASFSSVGLTAPLSTDNTSIGQPPGYVGYSGFWRNGFDYSVLTDGTNTFINAPSSNGFIFFRGNNGAQNGAVDPVFHTANRMFLNSANDLVVGGTVHGTGRLDGGWDPLPGISGEATSAPGVSGESVWHFGVFGESQNSAALGGYSVNSWAGQFGVDPNDSEALPKYGIYAFGYLAAARFDGNVSINSSLTPTTGPDGIVTPSTFTVNATSNLNGTLSVTGTSSFGNNLTLTKGQAYKPGGGSWSATSDLRVKKDIANFATGLADLEKVRVVKYKYNGLGGTEDTGEEFIGVVAQELETVAPFMVSTHPEKLHPNDPQSTDIKHVDPSAFVYMLVNSVKELAGKNRALDQQLAALDQRHQAFVASSAEQTKTLAELTQQNQKIIAQNAKLAAQNKSLIALLEEKFGTATVAAAQ